MRHSIGTRRLGRLLLLTLSVALGAACASSPKPPPVAPEVHTYRVGAPDRLLVHVLPDPVVEREVRVRPDGHITVDLIGDVPATGRTLEEIAADVQEKIGVYKRDAVATVSLQEALSSSITIFGQVLQPGSLILERNTRIAEAIGAVGGTNIFASKGRVRVIRARDGEAEVLRADLRAIQAGDQSTNFMVRDGDIVVVPPNALARVGFIMQTILFPFQPVFGAGQFAFIVSRGF